MRYAILFSGMSFRRHVNGLEFCYRTLIDRLGFAPEHIQVLSYDGSPRAFGEPDTDSGHSWPGDNTPYRMIVNGEGSREAFQRAMRSLAAKLQPQDQLFINTSGHGSHNGTAAGPDLLTFPYSQRFKRQEFCAQIAALPRHRSLVVLMSQCFSGGFNQAVLDASPADSTVIAAATSETRPSFASFEDINWDSFQRNWVAALAGHDVNGAPIQAGHTANAGHRSSGAPVTVREAFEYASTCSRMNPYDSPQFAARPDSAASTTLAELEAAAPRAAWLPPRKRARRAVANDL